MNVFLDIYLELNLGDDLFLETILSRYPNHNFYIRTNLDYSDFSKRHPNLKIINTPKILNFIIGKMKLRASYLKWIINYYKIDVWCVLGGSIFIEFLGWQELYKERLKIWSYLKKQKKHILALGCNFGPYENSIFRDKYYEAFSSLDDICFRDSSSYEMFKTLENARLGSDVVFSLNTYPTPYEKKENTIGISMIDLEDRKNLSNYMDKYLNYLSSIVQHYLKNDYEVYLLSLCKNEGDEVGISKLIEIIPDKEKLKVLKYSGNLGSFIDTYNSIEKIVVTRFHSFVLSIKNNQEIFLLNYSQKSENLVNDNNLNVKMASIECLSQNSSLPVFSRVNEIDQLVVGAEKQFLMLDEILEK